VQVTFGAFTFDGVTRELRCGDHRTHLSPKAFDLLAVLLHAGPTPVSKADLHHALWPDTFVSDGSLAVLIAELRRALGDSAQESVYIRTVSRFGYAFIADLHSAGAIGVKLPAGRHSLRWGHSTAWLQPGLNVLGRDPAADICLDAVGVSRRHAAITVSDSSVTLQDLHSKNGTFVNGLRVSGTVSLDDDADIRLGAVPVRFRRGVLAGPTQTVS
jgi:DNA-binding winged helix-turn-helix (wHTH) protein